MKLKDKVAIVTGGARGIGAAICRRYADEGARVVVADLLEDEARGLTGEIGRGAIAVRLDVTRRDSIDAAVATVVREAGGIDILVNNAGIFEMAPVLKITEESFDKQFAVNTKGLLFMLQAGAARSSTSRAKPAGGARRWWRSTAPRRRR
jgi:D-sorbitol dehydrogenase (acceptor)